jgi:hypothetical protein
MPFFNVTSQGGGNGIIGGRNPRFQRAFLTRQVITRGYLAAGYKDSVPWRNVNSILHSTDTSTNHGDLLGSQGGYVGGNHNANKQFVWGTGSSLASFNNASHYNMRTNTGLADFTMNQTMGDCEGIQDNDPQTGIARFAWITGNATNISKFNMTTESFVGSLSTSAQQGGTGLAQHIGDLWGYWWGDSAESSAADRRKFVFATETESTAAGNVGFHGQQKGTSTKLGKGYAGNQGSYNGGNQFRIWNYSTESISSVVAKPITDSGEENLDMGQAHNYMMGMYNSGGQNNRAWRLNYATDSGYEGGSSMQPSGPGIAGRSSGQMAWRD